MTALLKGPLGDDSFNMAKYLFSRLMQKETGRDPKDYAPFETAYMKQQLESKALSELNGQDGGFLAPEEWASEFHDVIRDNGIFRTLPVVRQYTKARIHHSVVGMSDWTFNYLGDNAALTSADRKFAQRTFTMHKATALATVSLELLQDASDLANQVLQQSAAEAVAFEQDRQALLGNGQGSTPTGLLNMTNVGKTDVAGASPTMVQLANMAYKAKALNESANVPAGSTSDIAIVAHPRIENTVRNMVTPGNTAPWLFGLGTEPVQRFLGAAWVLTAAVPITFSSVTNPNGGNQTQIFAGDWRRLRIISRSDFQFDLSREAGMQNNQVLVRVISRYDAQATHPEAFSIITSAIQ